LLPNGIPSHDTFRRVFMLIDPARFEACFEAWATAFSPALAQEIVAIDGKTIRRSFDRARFSEHGMSGFFRLSNTKTAISTPSPLRAL
jgi:hypothetical protein